MGVEFIMLDKLDNVLSLLKLCSPGMIFHDVEVVHKSIKSCRKILKIESKRDTNLYFAIVSLDNALININYDDMSRKQIHNLRNALQILRTDITQEERIKINDILFDCDLNGHTENNEDDF